MSEQRTAANKRVGRRLLNADPQLKAVCSARTVVPGLDGKTVLHSGPPVDWEEMIDPLRGALIGAIIYEGWADTETEAVRLLASGEVMTAPSMEHSVAAPLAGVTSPSMPVFVVEDSTSGEVAYTNFNEGLGTVLRYGAYDDEVLSRLQWLEKTMGPVLATVLEDHGSVALDPIIATAVKRGDECHNRNEAASSLLLDELAPRLFRSDIGREEAADVLEFVSDNPHFFLNLSIAAAFVRLQAAKGVEHSTIATSIGTNGTNFGIQISDGGEEWFTAPAPTPKGNFLNGYGPMVTAPVVGDSLVTEATGLGGFALAGAPAISDYLGVTVEVCREMTEQMYTVAVTEHETARIPQLDGRGTPVGIDAVSVVETGIEPVFNAGLAHTDRGKGQVGAALARMPIQAFKSAVQAARNIDGDETV